MKHRGILALCALLLTWLSAGCNSGGKEIVLTVKAPSLRFGSSAIGDDVLSSYDLLCDVGEDFSAQYRDAAVTVNVIQYNNAEELENIEKCYGTENAADVLMND